MHPFDQMESEVRSYCRAFPSVFRTARGAMVEAEDGRCYIDFLCGAGSLNYGHNNPRLKAQLIDYLREDGLVHGLDMATVAKREFLEYFEQRILAPRGLDYKVQFTGPTGTNAVEAALKVARNVTGRENVIAFTNAFHGVTLGSLAATANRHYRKASGIRTAGTTFTPYEGYLGADANTVGYLERTIADPSSGVDLPAAVIVETVQGEGGVQVASSDWLRALASLCRRHEILLIVDDIQVGCGRTGTFFSFEAAGIRPDLVVLSKSLSGFGLPLSVVLLRPELDQWEPGEHNGTFRGHNPAFVTARAAITTYWSDEALTRQVFQHGAHLRHRLKAIAQEEAEGRFDVRGRGLIAALDCEDGHLAESIARRAFHHGVIIETCGSRGEVIKLLPPLTAAMEELDAGLDALARSVAEVLEEAPQAKGLRGTGTMRP